MQHIQMVHPPHILSGEFPASGGKAQGLLALLRNGMQVPDFAIVPAAEAARAKPEDLGDLAEAFLVGRRSDARLAVRSSSSIEDRAACAGAGLGLTVLNVTGRAALAYAMQCVADSLESPVMAAYRARLGPAGRAKHGAPGDAVILQEMVRPEVSGVLFTCDPLTADPSQLSVEATAGPCHEVVEGWATAVAMIDRLTGATRRGGSRAEILTRTRLDALMDLADRHDAAVGLRADIEFAFLRDDTGRETLTLLQSRPVTTRATTRL